jgi:hypothetical protein
MKNTNGNLPAMPQTHSDNLCQQTGTVKVEHAGLTKREMFAMTAMQGLLSNATLKPYIGMSGFDSGNISLCAIVMADALLAELERQA